MKESLLSPSSVLLYGRELKDLKLDKRHPPGTGPILPRGGNNLFLQNQLDAADARFARIYAFAYEGHSYDLARPIVLLVHGRGEDPDAYRPTGEAPHDRLARAPGYVDRTGTADQIGSFAEDIKVWAYDKADFSIRLDMDTGPLEQILLDAECEVDQGEGYYSGSRARVSGSRARVSGSRVRIRDRQDD